MLPDRFFPWYRRPNAFYVIFIVAGMCAILAGLYFVARQFGSMSAQNQRDCGLAMLCFWFMYKVSSINTYLHDIRDELHKLNEK